MAMVMLLPLLELEGQIPSSLEDDGRGHGHPHNSSVRKGGRWSMAALTFSLGLGRADLLFSSRHAMTISTALHWGKEGGDHGHHPLILRTRRAVPPFSRR